MNARSQWLAARRLYRISAADPGFSYDNTMTRSGRNPFARGHVNPTRNEAIALASRLNPECIRFLGPRDERPMTSELRQQWQHNSALYTWGDDAEGLRIANARRRAYALRELRTALLFRRSAHRGSAQRVAT